MAPEFENRPIGVFDSGLGGLTILRALRESFPNESFIYLGDTARIPYGTKSPPTILKYLKQNIAFLSKQPVKAVVVACNTASSVLSQSDFDLPVYDVIAPGAKAALQATTSNRIGVIATRATVANRSYVTAIQNIRPESEVFQQACPLFVPLVEEGWEEDPITNLIAYRYLSPLQSKNIDTLVLGCTHYPFLKSAIRKVLGNSVALIDSASSICDRLTADFSRGDLLKNPSPQMGATKIYVTDLSPQLPVVAERYLKSTSSENIELIDL